MTITRLTGGASRLVLIAALAGFTLSACNQPANTAAPQDATAAPPPLAALPLADTAAPITPAPTGAALPSAPLPRRARLANPGDSYAYADRAYGLNRAFGDAPPDYTFDYDGVRPWVWRSDSDDVRVVEPLDGGDRYYYYQPGADTPYLVRDPDYSYAYQDGQVVAIYDRAGRLLDDAAAEQRLDYAGRYLARARAIYDASRQRQHEAVAQANWTARRQAIGDERARWAQAQQQQADWRAYHDQHDAEQQAHWDDERYRREAEAARFAQSIHDAAAAQHDLAAARDAQARAASRGAPPGAAPTGPGQGPGQGRGLGAQGFNTPFAPRPAAQPPVQSQAAPPPAPVQPAPGQGNRPPRYEQASPGQPHGAPVNAPTGPTPAQQQGQAEVVREAQARNLAEQNRQAADAQRLQVAQQAQAQRQAQQAQGQRLAAQQAQAARQAREAQAAQQAQVRGAEQAQAQAQARAAAEAKAGDAARARAAVQAQTVQRAQAQQQQAAQARVAAQAQAQAAAVARAKAAAEAQAAKHPVEKPKSPAAIPPAPGQPR